MNIFSRTKAQSLVEYALIFPLMFLIVMCILDLGRAVYYYTGIQNAAREGARYGVIYPDDSAGIEGAVRYIATGLIPADLAVTSTMVDDDTLRVRVTYSFHIITPVVGAFFGTDTITLASQATMRIEQ